MTSAKQPAPQCEQAEMPEDDDLHGFVDGKFVPVSVVDGKLVTRIEGRGDPKPVKRSRSSTA